MVRGLETRRPRGHTERRKRRIGVPRGPEGKHLAAHDVDSFLHRLPDIIKVKNVTRTCQNSAKKPLWTRSTSKSPPKV